MYFFGRALATSGRSLRIEWKINKAAAVSLHRPQALDNHSLLKILKFVDAHVSSGQAKSCASFDAKNQNNIMASAKTTKRFGLQTNL